MQFPPGVVPTNRSWAASEWGGLSIGTSATNVHALYEYRTCLLESKLTFNDGESNLFPTLRKAATIEMKDVKRAFRQMSLPKALHYAVARLLLTPVLLRHACSGAKEKWLSRAQYLDNLFADLGKNSANKLADTPTQGSADKLSNAAGALHRSILARQILDCFGPQQGFLEKLQTDEYPEKLESLIRDLNDKSKTTETVVNGHFDILAALVHPKGGNFSDAVRNVVDTLPENVAFPLWIKLQVGTTTRSHVQGTGGSLEEILQASGNLRLRQNHFQ
jgi:hypothetical protein